MIFKLKNSTKVKLDGFTAYLYNKKTDYPNLSTVFVDCHKNHYPVYVKNSHRLYFVIEGKGQFEIDDKEYDVDQNDVIVIEPKVKYSYSGKMKLFEANFPATDENDEVLV